MVLITASNKKWLHVTARQRALILRLPEGYPDLQLRHPSADGRVKGYLQNGGKKERCPVAKFGCIWPRW